MCLLILSTSPAHFTPSWLMEYTRNNLNHVLQYQDLIAMDNDKITLDFTTISRALKTFSLPDVDHVIGIATGGTVPASLVAHQLNRPMSLIEINYRLPDNSPRYPEPVLVSWQPLPAIGQRILLVDEVAVSGKTMRFAQTFLKDYEVITFVLKGTADYVLFPEIDSCVNWPWKLQPQE